MRPLSPAQRVAFDHLLRCVNTSPIAVLDGRDGSGKTNILLHLAKELEGEYLTLSPLGLLMRSSNPLAIEEMFERIVSDALSQYPAVLVDDINVLMNVVESCGSYPRTYWFSGVVLRCIEFAEKNNRKLIFAGNAPGTFRTRGYGAYIPQYQIEDYEFIARQYLKPEIADRIDFAHLYRYATHLDAREIRSACRWLIDEQDLTTEGFIDYLRSQGLSSNIDLSEVRNVTLRDLQGMNDVISSLETHVVLPLENDALATEYGLRPKRGVLLLGPPGTGKTTIGRALAHRLKSKFFRIDGTFIPGNSDFYWRIESVFNQARDNAPAVVFIDDCDAMFQSGQELGLYRYLLTMLDGLESEGCRDVCVVFTAMHLADLPPALLRSGRIELWLETGALDAAAREKILSAKLANVPADLQGVDVAALVTATEGFVGADLDPVVADGKKLFVADKLAGKPLAAVTEYFLQAAAEVRNNKERYRTALMAAHGPANEAK